MGTLHRHSGLVVESSHDQTVVYVVATGDVHVLDATAGAVFQATDGQRSIPEIAAFACLDSGEVDRAVRLLLERGLVVDGVTRRAALQRGALVGGAALASPMIMSMVAPRLAAAASVLTPPASGGATPLTVGSRVSLQRRSPAGSYVSDKGADPHIAAVSAGDPQADRDAATFIVRQGLADASYISFESVDFPGSYLRHAGYVLYVHNDNGTALFKADASFTPVAALSGPGTSFQSYNFPDHLIRVFGGTDLTIAATSGPNPWDDPNNYADDTAFVVSPPLAP